MRGESPGEKEKRKILIFSPEKRDHAPAVIRKK